MANVPVVGEIILQQASNLAMPVQGSVPFTDAGAEVLHCFDCAGTPRTLG